MSRTYATPPRAPNPSSTLTLTERAVDCDDADAAIVPRVPTMRCPKMPDPSSQPVSTVVSERSLGRWPLGQRIGHGGIGEVWRGADRERGLPVAVKVVRADVPDAERAMLAQEERIVASLDHPGIVRVVDVGEVSDEDAAASGGQLAAGAPWLAMELFEGGTPQVPTTRKRGLDSG